jgi:hypothetical protein
VGVDGVLVVKISPVASSMATMSVNVPPVSMPTRRRRILGAGGSSSAICMSAIEST